MAAILASASPEPQVVAHTGAPSLPGCAIGGRITPTCNMARDIIIASNFFVS